MPTAIRNWSPRTPSVGPSRLPARPCGKRRWNGTERPGSTPTASSRIATGACWTSARRRRSQKAARYGHAPPPRPGARCHGANSGRPGASRRRVEGERGVVEAPAGMRRIARRSPHGSRASSPRQWSPSRVAPRRRRLVGREAVLRKLGETTVGAVRKQGAFRSDHE